MKCLHGEPAAQSTTQNGTFWYCNQNPSCQFFCSADESYLFEKGIAAWKSTKQPHPSCDGHRKLAKMRVVKDLMKPSYGRPFFVCSESAQPCRFWQWGDVEFQKKPECRHGLTCKVRKVKKDGFNKDRKFFCCPLDKENSCKYFEWLPDEPYYDTSLIEPASKPANYYLENSFINDFANLKI